jgi:hypothetical protein
MQSDQNDGEPVPGNGHDAAPCCAKVWDPTLKVYRNCDEWADPASDSDLCTKHDERLTAIVSLITAAQTTARINELEEQRWEHPVP